MMNEDAFEIFESHLASADKQGDVGEVLTASELRSLGLHVIRNLYLPYKGRYTEIDLIGISAYGLFVVENKNYSGTVSGNISDNYWDVSYSLFRSESLRNPVKQNIAHKCAVIEQLTRDNMSTEHIFRPVIFNDRCKLEVTGAEKDVFTLSRFREVYLGHVSKSNELLTEDNQFKLCQYLGSFSDHSYEMRSAHVRLLKGV